MGFVHNVEIVWEDLMDAFSNGRLERTYFLDRLTGEIFFVPSALEDEEFWRQMETNSERFLEIPGLDYGLERQIELGFAGKVENSELRAILSGTLAGRKGFGCFSEIISFFPEEEQRMLAMKDEFLAGRVKNWLEENNLFAANNGSFSAAIPQEG